LLDVATHLFKAIANQRLRLVHRILAVIHGCKLAQAALELRIH